MLFFSAASFTAELISDQNLFWYYLWFQSNNPKCNCWFTVILIFFCSKIQNHTFTAIIKTIVQLQNFTTEKLDPKIPSLLSYTNKSLKSQCKDWKFSSSFIKMFMVDVRVLQIQVRLGMSEWRQSDMVNTGTF